MTVATAIKPSMSLPFNPQRLYALLKDWKPDGPPLKENPLFYESMNDESTQYMDLVSRELIEICKKLKENGINTDIVQTRHTMLTT